MRIVLVRACLTFALVIFVPVLARASACSDLVHETDAATGGPVFLASYPTATDKSLRGVAYLYDNAAAALALIGCGEPSRAQRIGDAILRALDRDRAWHDGRLRNGYAAGAVGEGSVRLPGWWDPKQSAWVEDRYVEGSDTGNVAWAMLALDGLGRTSPRYVKGAARVGGWLATRFDSRAPAGFSGGTLGGEPNPAPVTWKSTEHNTDVAASFARLADLAPDPRWRRLSAKAARFVRAMWLRRCSCFAAGTAEDRVTTNTSLALDAQILPLLALPNARRYAGAVETADRRLTVGGGLAYGEAGKSVWTEGTAQMALLIALSGQTKRVRALSETLANSHNATGGYFATPDAAVPTGFGLATDPTQQRVYFHLPHLAALAWAAMFERRFNPFTLTGELPDSRH